MHLRVFKEIDKKKRFLFVIFIVLLFLFSVFLFLRSYAIYEEKNQFHMISGNVPDQNYDLKFSFLLEDEGESTFFSEMPKDKKYLVSISCNHDAVGKWDYDSWGPLITNLSQTQTKCNITFSTSYPLEKYGVHERLTRVESGLYEVSHFDADITYTDDVSAQNLLKETEYRYAGSNPDNYVWFNEELWRIIGLVNTPEGQRIKIIRDESIGEYSWDTSAANTNSGYGVNEWSQADLKTLLNGGAYYNRSNGTCYSARYNEMVSCDFSGTGLANEAKAMIDTITWNTGSYDINVYSYDSMNVPIFYNQERSKSVARVCNASASCNDNVTRTTTWKGQVGLMYPSDYGYAMGGGPKVYREMCLNMTFWDLPNYEECIHSNWLNQNYLQLLMTPGADVDIAHLVYRIDSTGTIYIGAAGNKMSVRPSVYLKSNVKIIDGSGTRDYPYILKNA